MIPLLPRNGSERATGMLDPDNSPLHLILLSAGHDRLIHIGRHLPIVLLLRRLRDGPFSPHMLALLKRQVLGA